MKNVFFYYALGKVLTGVLPKSWAFRLADLIAGIYAQASSKDLGAVMANLREVLPKETSQKELKTQAKKLIVNFSHYLVDLFYSHELSEAFIEEHIEILGLEHLDRELQKEKGVILASAHLGHWEMGGMTLARLGYPIHGIALKHKDERIDRLFQKRRELHGLKIIPVGGALKTCYKILAAGEILALNADRLFSSAGIAVRFMNRDVYFPKGISRLGLATGASVLPTFFVSRGYNQYVLEIQAPLVSTFAESMTRAFAMRVEEKIKQVPCQWFIFQPFWEAPEWPV